MLNWLLFGFLFLLLFGMTRYDRRLYGNYFSPVAVLGWPLLLLLSLALIAAEPLGFLPLRPDVLILCIFALPVFWLGSLVWSVILPKSLLRTAVSRFQYVFPIRQAPLKWTMLILSWLIIILMLLSLMRAVGSSLSLSAMGTDEFTYAYSGSGWAGHVLVLAILALIYLIGIVRKTDFLTLVTIMLLIVLLLLQQVKTWLYVPLVGGILLRFYNLRKIRVNPILLVTGLAAGVALFFLTYYFAVGIDEGDFARKNYNIARHFLGYVFAGVLGFGEHMQRGLPVGELPEVLFMPLINLWKFITGQPVSGVVSNYHVWIDVKSQVDVNVKTFPGTIYIHGGMIWGLVYLFLAGCMLYFNWILASLSKNYWFTVLYILLAAPLALGWFDFYYNQLTFIELPVILVVIAFLSHKKADV